MYLYILGDKTDTMIQSTASLTYSHTEHIPEFPDDELRAVLRKISEKNANLITNHGCETSWRQEYFPTDDVCILCGTTLGRLEHVPGTSADALLLTKIKLVPVKAIIKRCPNSTCLARHSYCTWREGM